MPSGFLDVWCAAVPASGWALIGRSGVEGVSVEAVASVAGVLGGVCVGAAAAVVGKVAALMPEWKASQSCPPTEGAVAAVAGVFSAVVAEWNCAGIAAPTE